MALFVVYFLGGLECVGHSFAYVAYFAFSRDVWIRTQRAAVANLGATNLATHLLKKIPFHMNSKSPHLPQLQPQST